MKTRRARSSRVSRPAASATATAVSAATLRRLERAARAAATAAYAPYSDFQVGAAILDDLGRLTTGANVENASFGLTNCAERTAIFAAVAAGARHVRCVVVYTPTATPTPPCGACRQVINEFGPTARVICLGAGDDRIDTTLDALLPGAFGPQNLT